MEKIIVDISWLDNYGASSEDILGCVATHSTLEGVKRAYTDALKFHLEGLEEDEIPEKVKGNYKLVFKLDVHALLNHFNGIITRSALSRVTGINERQLGHYATGHRKPRPAQRVKIVKGIHYIGKEFIKVV